MEWALLRASIWSDWVRPRHNDARSPTVVWFHHGEEHYTTIPLIDPKDEVAFANKTLVSPDQTDVLCGLKHWCSILRTARPLRRTRRSRFAGYSTWWATFTSRCTTPAISPANPGSPR